MNNIEEVVNKLENKISKVLNKLEVLNQTAAKLKQELAESEAKVEVQKVELETWEERYEALKIANTILGSNENKRETKLKINTLIREIDYCIAQLSE